MPLLINLRQLDKSDLGFRGAMQADDLELNSLDELIHITKPINYEFTIQKVGDEVIVRGWFSLVLECECSRCLKKFDHPLLFENWVCDLPLAGEEKVSPVNDCVDLTPFIREDILLEFPQHPLCKIECAGLPKNADETANHQKSPNQALEGSAWAELNKLKF